MQHQDCAAQNRRIESVRGGVFAKCMRVGVRAKCIRVGVRAKCVRVRARAFVRSYIFYIPRGAASFADPSTKQFP